MTKQKYYKYYIICFKFFNILITFQNYINKIFIKKINLFMIISLNKILIYIKIFS